MTMTTADARLAYHYLLRDVALGALRRAERLGYEVKLRYEGENQVGTITFEPRMLMDRIARRPRQVTITLSRYTDEAMMERNYMGLIEAISAITG